MAHAERDGRKLKLFVFAFAPSKSKSSSHSITNLAVYAQSMQDSTVSTNTAVPMYCDIKRRKPDERFHPPLMLISTSALHLSSWYRDRSVCRNAFSLRLLAAPDLLLVNLQGVSVCHVQLYSSLCQLCHTSATLCRPHSKYLAL